MVSQSEIYGLPCIDWTARKVTLELHPHPAPPLFRDREKETVSESDLNYPTWQVALQEAIVEVDRKKLAEKIQRVEAIIFERLQTISFDTDRSGARKALADAGSALRALKKERLSYPDWNA